MLAPGNYVQWKSRIKRYIDTKPNHELIHYCLENPPYKLDWKDVKVSVYEGSPITTTARIRETYKNVSQDIRDQLNAEAEAVQIILTGIDNDIYLTVDACLNACEMWKAIERSAGYKNQRNGNVAGDRETVGSSVVSNDDHYNVFAMESTHPEQSKSVHDTYPIEQDAQNVIIDLSDMNYDREEIDQIDDDNDLAKEQANNKLSETNNLLYADYKKSEAELARRNSKEYTSQIELECAKVRAPDFDEVIRLEKESRSKLSDLIRPFDYTKLNNLYDLFVPQREKSSEQRYFSERSRLSHINVNNGKSKESFNKQTTLLEKRMDESIPLDKQ
nr:hypothetical protein [Tanacetum cinerariifolium]